MSEVQTAEQGWGLLLLLARCHATPALNSTARIQPSTSYWEAGGHTLIFNLLFIILDILFI